MDLSGYKQFLKDDHPLPLYYQLANILEHYINKSGLEADADFLSEVDIAAQLGISRPTVSKAIKILLESGLLRRERGKGAVVNVDPKIPLAVLSEHSSFGKSFASDDQRPHTELMSRSVIKPNPKTLKLLELGPGEKAIYLRRLRKVNDINLVIVESYLSHPRYQGLMDIPAKAFSQSDLYSLIEEHFKDTVVRSEREVTAYRMSMEDAEVLNMEIWDPCLRATGIAFAQAGHVVELFDARFNGVRCSLKATIHKQSKS